MLEVCRNSSVELMVPHLARNVISGSGTSQATTARHSRAQSFNNRDCLYNHQRTANYSPYTKKYNHHV